MPYRLGSILIEEKLCSKDDIEKALDYQKETGYLIGECLLHLNLCSEEHINYVVYKQMEINSKRKKQGFDLKDLKSLFKIIFSYKLLIFALICFSLLSALFSANIVLPITIGFIVDNVLPTNDINLVLVFSIVGLFGLILGNLFNFYLANVVVTIISKVSKNIQNTLLTHLISIPYAIFQKFKKGDILSRFSDNIESIAMFLNLFLQVKMGKQMYILKE